MNITTHRLTLLAAALFGLGLPSNLFAENRVQEMLELPVRVVDPDGKPVAGAKITPWALRYAGGHGLWRQDGVGGSEPPVVMTAADGLAIVPYPRYANAAEWMRTMEVTLSVDHPEFAMAPREFIDVPPKDGSTYQITLKRGTVVEIVPIENGQLASMDNLYILWSDDRSWHPGVKPERVDAALRLPPMRTGKQQVMLIRLEGEQATHFSKVVDLDLSADEHRESVELKPAVGIKGVLSADVPRPVKKGRVKVATLQDEQNDYGVDWVTWRPIAEDGTFVIEGWPAGEAIQVTALCDGYIAKSGDTPAVVKDRRDPDPYYRPQVFTPERYASPLPIAMAPLVRCEIEAVDPSGQALAGVKVQSYPNVGWWHSGSQGYGIGLARGERRLALRDYQAALEEEESEPYATVTDAHGHGVLYLPAGEQGFRTSHEKFELPIVRGRRHREVELAIGEPSTIRLEMQPKGNEFLGEWDKLSGVLFGCTGEECKRLLDDPGFRKRIAVVGEQLDSAENPTDPKVLSDAFEKMAAAFDEVDDQEEAAKWRRKAAEQAAKAKAQTATGR